MKQETIYKHGWTGYQEGNLVKRMDGGGEGEGRVVLRRKEWGMSGVGANE